MKDRRLSKCILFSRAIFQKKYPYCIISTACPSARYPYIYYDGRMQLAHRLSYEIYKGSIPLGYEVDHLCFNARCINPGHIQAVDPITNYERAMRQPGGWHRGERNGQAKLTEDQVKEIKDLQWTTCLTQKEIGQKFGVSSSTISKIYTENSWTHVK